MRKNEIKKVRCCIYTRKSIEEGLDMSFNTLDAQRDAGESYIASQRGNGWICLPEHYDDGGFSGGNNEKPNTRCSEKIRHQQLEKLNLEMKEDFIKSQRGKILPVIFETVDKSGIAHGWSDNYIAVTAPATEVKSSVITAIKF